MMGNYSLLDAINPVQITPLGQAAMDDPRAMQRMGHDLAGMSAYQGDSGVLLPAEPEGSVYGQEGRSFLAATPEDDTNIVLKAIGTILGAPFNLLRGAKEGLEDALGHPYAQQRQAQDEQYAMLASTLSDSDKSLVGMPFDRTGINSRQASGDTVATGQNYGISPTLTPRKTGILEMLTGESRKQRALQMARLQAALKAQGIELDIESARAGIYKDLGAGTNSFASANKTDMETYQLGKYGEQDWRAKIDAQVANAEQSRAAAGAQGALAGKYGAEAGLAGARTDQVNAMTPAMTYREYAAGNRSQAAADKDWALLSPQVAKERTAAIKNMATASAAAAREVATGRPSALQAASALNAANTDDEKRTTAAGLGVNMVPKPGMAGSIFGKTEPDLAGYAAKLSESMPQKSGAERLQELIAQIDNFQLKDVSAPQTGVGGEASTQDAVVPGQMPSTDGETEEIFKEYGRSPKAIDAAYRAGLISESAARKALEAIGYQRAR